MDGWIGDTRRDAFSIRRNDSLVVTMVFQL